MCIGSLFQKVASLSFACVYQKHVETLTDMYRGANISACMDSYGYILVCLYLGIQAYSICIEREKKKRSERCLQARSACGCLSCSSREEEKISEERKEKKKELMTLWTTSQVSYMRTELNDTSLILYLEPLAELPRKKENFSETLHRSRQDSLHSYFFLSTQENPREIEDAHPSYRSPASLSSLASVRVKSS